MQKYINLSSSGWSATGRIYIFGNILDLNFLCSTNAMGDLEKFQYGCNLFSNKQGTIYGFYCIVKMSSCVHIEIQLNTELISIFVVMYFLFR